MSATIRLRPEDEQFVDRLIASGRYGSREDVVSEAIRVVTKRDEWRATVEAAIEEGLADIDAGRTFSIDEVREHFRSRSRDAA